MPASCLGCNSRESGYGKPHVAIGPKLPESPVTFCIAPAGSRARNAEIRKDRANGAKRTTGMKIQIFHFASWLGCMIKHRITVVQL